MKDTLDNLITKRPRVSGAERNDFMSLLVPPIVQEKYEELYDLCQNHHKNGQLRIDDVAQFMGKDRRWLQQATYIGAVPFAFGTTNVSGRGSSSYHVLPVWAFFTQNVLGQQMAENILNSPDLVKMR